MLIPEGTDPHARMFGVEIECGLPGGTTKAAELFDFELHYEDGYTYHEDENGDGWSLDSDGSGVELRTPPLQGEHGFRSLRYAMERLRDNGGYVTGADGLHVHHDAPDFESSPSNCMRLVRSWLNNQHAIHEMVAPRRRRSGACPAWGDQSWSNLEAWSRGDVDYLQLGRNDLNIASLADKGTVEFRLHEGTLDADVAIAWIEFGQRFLHEALHQEEPIETTETDALLMSRIRLSDKAQAILAEKKSRSFITPGSGFRTRNAGDYDY